MIIFENSGEIDIRLAVIIGTNVKETDHPVGFFGTGLKYAIASVLRWGGAIAIQSGLAEFTFTSSKTTLRGKDFNLISMNGAQDRLELGFTTELGKNWQPWMIYRELWCNAHDEEMPNVFLSESKPKPLAGKTRVIVDELSLLSAHESRENFILTKGHPPLFVSNSVEIYSGISDKIFYRGIAVQELAKPSLYTYNILGNLFLTEDRTAPAWSTEPMVLRALVGLEDEAIIRTTLCAPSTSYEANLDYDFTYGSESILWKEIAQQLSEERALEIPSTVRRRFFPLAETKYCPSCGQAII